MARKFKALGRGDEVYPVMQADGSAVWLAWRRAKNARVMQKHGLSFDAVVVSVAYNGLGDTRPHYNIEKYPDQHIIQQKVSGVLCDIPCKIIWSENDGPCFYLLTIKDKPKK